MTCQRASEIHVSEFLVDGDDSRWDDFRGHYPGCPDCAAEVAGWTGLESALREGVETADAHPAAEHLATFADTPGELEAPERAQITRHVQHCRECEAAVTLLQGFRVEPVAAEARAESLGERLTGLARGLFPDGLALATVAAAAVLLVLLVPVGLQLWRSAWAPSAGSGLPEAPIAVEEPLPEEAPEQIAQQPTPPPRPEQIAQQPTPPPRPEQIAQQPTPPPRPEQIAQQPTPPPELEPPSAPEPAEPTPSPAPEVPRETVLAQTPPPAPPPIPTPEVAPPPREAPIQIAALIPTGPPLYPGLPGEGIRTAELVRSASAPRVFALAPEHVGQTLETSPTLYWYLEEASDLALRVTLIEETADAVVEATLDGPHGAGIHALPLSGLGIVLEPAGVYEWSVAVVVDPEWPARDVRSAAALRLVPADAAFAAKLDASPAAERAHVYAAAGYWYDAFDLLSVWLSEEPDAAVLHRHRAALLEQVDLREAAAVERRAAEGSP